VVTFIYSLKSNPHIRSLVDVASQKNTTPITVPFLHINLLAVLVASRDIDSMNVKLINQLASV
jgi:hypothetical protein